MVWWKMHKTKKVLSETTEGLAHNLRDHKLVYETTGGLPLMYETIRGLVRDVRNHKLTSDILQGSVHDLNNH